MLDDAFAYFEGQIQPAKGRIALLEVLDDAQRMQIVIEEEPMLAHGASSAFSPAWPKGGCPMSCTRASASTRSTFRCERGCDGARDLRDFDGVGQAVAKMIGVAAGENLGLGFEAAEGARMDDAVAVALEVVAVGMWRLGVAAPARIVPRAPRNQRA